MSITTLKERLRQLRNLSSSIRTLQLDEDRQHRVTPELLSQKAAYDAELAEVEAAIRAIHDGDH